MAQTPAPRSPQRASSPPSNNVAPSSTPLPPEPPSPPTPSSPVPFPQGATLRTILQEPLPPELQKVDTHLRSLPRETLARLLLRYSFAAYGISDSAFFGSRSMEDLGDRFVSHLRFSPVADLRLIDALRGRFSTNANAPSTHFDWLLPSLFCRFLEDINPN